MFMHPMDYLRVEFLEPLNVTQHDLCKHLDLGSKTISELYQKKRGMSVHVAKKFSLFTCVSAEQLLQMQAVYDLKHDNEDFKVKPLAVPPNTKALVNLLGCSLKELRTLFKAEDCNGKQELCRLLFENVPLNKTVKYMRDSKIGLSHLKHLYKNYLKLEGAKKKASFEKLFMDDDKTAVLKMCDNGSYFDDPREFEKYVFNRVSMLHNKKLFTNLVEDSSKPEEIRKRAAYLYEFTTGKRLKASFTQTPVKLYDKAKRVRVDQVGRYSVVAGLDYQRFEQFLQTGNF